VTLDTIPDVATLERLTAADLGRVATGYRDALRAHQDALNRLNVYPVPDGDTGTNMALTLESVVDALDGADGMEATCAAISHGSLMGARGNSGVILSQVLRGLAERLRSLDAADARVVAAALGDASAAAYQAVMRPVEGTILTVVRDAAEGAAGAADEGGDLATVLDAAAVAAQASLANTPELLPVLKEAGVVDAGGAGFCLLLDVLLNVVDGRAIPEPPEAPATALRPTATAASTEAHHGGIADLRYEVMYLLDAPDGAIPGFKDVWAGLGDSIVVVGGDGLWNCHIHTDDIGAAIEAALDCGRPRKIRVTDLIEQVEEERWVRDAGPFVEDPVPLDEVPCAVVAIATGDGVRRIFRSLGVHHVVAGGQSMNPSTAQILEAVQAVSADQVVVLPNNKNIIPVAEQVDALTDKVVRVVPTKGITEGFAALLVYDPETSAEGNAASMAESAARITSGEVTRAVRDSNTDAGPVKEGDYVGIARDGIRVVAPDLPGAAVGLLDDLVGDGHEIVTIIEGEGATAGTTRHITEWLAENRPSVSPEIHHGGQALYPYLFGVE
jgi:uncharacterized protein